MIAPIEIPEDRIASLEITDRVIATIEVTDYINPSRRRDRLKRLDEAKHASACVLLPTLLFGGALLREAANIQRLAITRKCQLIKEGSEVELIPS
jgi:hypothetical protein